MSELPDLVGQLPYRRRHLGCWGTSDKLKTSPFAHIVLDDWWDPFLISMVHEEIGLINESAWHHTQLVLAGGRTVEDKRSLNFEHCSATRCISEIHARLRSRAFISWLEDVIGIRRLHFDTVGGGVHRIVPGGLLERHIDFNVDAEKRWRRVNVLTYLNEVSVGGELKLFNREGKAEIVIAPEPNRMVIFECGEMSWHGHPTPLGAGPDRLSIAAYYFTYEEPKGAAAPHSTVWFL